MNILYLTYPLNGLLMVGLPIGLGIYLTRRFKMRWKLWWIGTAVFILSQIGHIPFNNWLFGLFERGVILLPSPDWELPVYAILSGLSAGLWEESSRYAMYRWWAKDARSWREGLLLGAGHGGIEAILLGFLVLITFIQLAVMRGSDLSAWVPADQIGSVRILLDTYWTAEWPLTLLGAAERAFTIPFHISASLLVLQAFTRRRIYWLGLAILWHTFVDAAIPGLAWPLLQPYPWGAYLVELLLGLTVPISLWIIFKLRKPEPETAYPEPIPSSTVSTPPPLPEIEATPENLEDTRYN